MNKTQIDTVERLRREGKGLSVIAQETGISINTIKSHLSRHGISAPRLIRTCMFCNAEIKTTDHFCSDACRSGWYESHSSDEQDILRLCKACGKPFEPRQSKQVYCSKQCFYNDRYHSKQTITEDENLQQVLMSIPYEAAVALVEMTMEYLLVSGWQAPGIEELPDPSNIADAFYMRLNQKTSVRSELGTTAKSST